MVSISKISFKGQDTNLLKNFSTETKQIQQTEQVTPKTITVPKDTFEIESKKSIKTSNFIKDYSGIIALIVSTVGIPVTYVISKRNSNKANEELIKSIKELKAQIEKEAAPAQTVSKKANLVTILLGIGSGAGIAELIKNKREDLHKQGYTDDEITEAGNTATSIVEGPKRAMDKANDAYRVSEESKHKSEEAQKSAHFAHIKADSLNGRINDIGQVTNSEDIRPEVKKFFTKYYDLWIMQCPDWGTKINNLRSEDTMNAIHNAAISRLHRSAQDTVKDIKNYKEKYNNKLTSLWALTAEFKPIKLGGLGDVPCDLQDNFTKLGIDNPTFIPMYEKSGQSRFIDNGDGTYEYQWGKTIFPLERLADISINTSSGTNSKATIVQFFQYEKDGEKLIFVKNDCFKGDIYDSTLTSDQPEKFAIFDKAVYMLAKAKVAEALDDSMSAPVQIRKGPAYNKLKAPNSMILNDWHAAPMAGLLRYRVPMEYNYNDINKKTFEALSNMPLLMIGHNLNSQGASNASNSDIQAKNNITQNVINTLYGRYAMGVLENAHSGIEDEDLCNTVLLKRKTADKQFNALFHGIALSDWFVPVSKNYSNEIVNDVKQSGIAKPLLEIRKPTGTVEGIINGTDKDKHDMASVAKNPRVDNMVISQYDQNSDISTIMNAKAENKQQFFNAFVKPILSGEITTPELVGANKNITEEEFMEAPLISFAHRLTKQKGLSLLKGAVFRLFDEWDNLFPNQVKPFFIIGGPAVEDEEVNYLYELKNPNYGTNKERIDRVIALKGNMPNPAIMSASTFFCAPSTFEPCGLTQGECFAKGTPVITTDTGGFHDTIVDGKTGFLAPQISEQSVYETLVRALKIYYYEPEKYKQMIKNDLAIDFSWARKGREGAIFEYTDKLGFNRKNLPDIGKNKTKS